ncbi:MULTISPECIES: MFS transporter [Micrococcales]|nr:MULTISPECIES: MFS transporter [Micrococcales]KZE91725.1 Antiseptic resistance protein [Microbacterium sp. TNHR37B]MCJ2194765.1 MFS transporter [Kaistella montana]MCT1446290.1 MFS transporter [Brevibacterium casei]NYF30415.1 DHA2 family multidrug resistance protein-like MFS transporter [Microbacterium sp. JAI119]
MDGSILFLAMPSINEAIQPTTDQSLWILDIYGFAVGSLLITFGNLGDRFGRKKLLMIGAVIFGIGSLCGAFSPTPELLIASRALMGLGGATLLPSCLAVISELFENPVQRARAIGIFAATFAAGFVIGPIVGGILLNHFWWGSVFLINIPVIALFLIMAPVLLREVHGTRPGKIDLLSVASSAVGLLIAIYGVKHAATYGIDLLSGALILAGIGVLTFFVLRQKRLEIPLLDIALFKSHVFAVAILTGLLSLFVWSAAAYLSMTYLQSVLGYSVLNAALLAIPGAVVLTLSSVLAPRLVEKVGPRAALIICHFSMAAGMGLLILTNDSTGAVFYIASTVVAGIGFGISFSLVADTAVGAVPESRAGAAGAIAETSNEIGNALGIALLGSLLTVVFRATYPGEETGIAEVVDGAGTATAMYETAQTAFLNGFHAVAATAAVICAALGILAIRWIPKSTALPSAYGDE